jgi:hypothetical protein
MVFLKTSVAWITRNIRNKMFERDRLKRKAISSDLSEDWSQYKHRNSVNIAMREQGSTAVFFSRLAYLYMAVKSVNR